MKLTLAQQKAVAARGNVLVVAGAGTGKTSTLVARCLACLLEEKPPASLDELLIVTFTDAAAAEMRQRLRAQLEIARDTSRGAFHWEEQLALFETAHIGTLHSFCLRLLREHFYELELDPQLTVLPEEEARMLADETLDAILRAHYAGDSNFAAAVQQLVQSHGRGWDQPVRNLVLRLHHYTQTLRDADGWFEAQIKIFESPAPAQWQAWLVDGVSAWRERWLAALANQAAVNPKAAACAEILRGLPATPTREQCAAVLAQIRLADGDWGRKKTALRTPIKALFEDAAFLESLAKMNGTADPLAEDWEWSRGQMTALLRLAREFSVAFSTAKRELAAVDFHDLEQHALRLLWDRATGGPTAIARQWREKLRFVFVDEYQDINEAQDAILTALSREGAAANRFLVGDVKQSIYRFRLAEPRIFQAYTETWRAPRGTTIPLVENFRSREPILDFVNVVFGALMRRDFGNVAYDEEARLRFGAPQERAPLAAASDPAPRVELLLRVKSAEVPSNSDVAPDAAQNEIANLEESGREARFVALRLREMKKYGHQVWDEAAKAFRPADWGDMAVLLRSPAGKAESFAREFSRLGIPLEVARTGFYETSEIIDLLSLLQILDNPLQDLPVLAVLRSPLVGLTLDELATIRLALPKGHFWSALLQCHETNSGNSGWPKVDRFLKNFAEWRRLTRQASLSRCLEAVLDGAHYADWLLTQPRGDQRRANVQRFLALARQFDRFQRQSLGRFLRFIEAQQAAETGPEVAAVSGKNAVALMSIHQSKGLEFPIVVVADLGKPFNLLDLHAEIILDAQYGLCPHIKPPHTGRSYPSLPHWLARQRQTGESLGEELRLLYVAMTRARDTLVLAGSVAGAKLEVSPESARLDTVSLLAARNYLDWLLAWAASAGVRPTGPTGENRYWRWSIADDADPRLREPAAVAAAAAGSDDAGVADAGSLQALRERLAWQYPHSGAAQLPAKTSVTALRHRLADETDDEARPLFEFKPRESKAATGGRLSATEIGTAHHTFLQLVALEQTGSEKLLRAEAKGLGEKGALSADEIAELDFAALVHFWQSELGRDIRDRAAQVRRELPFTARFSPDELGLAADQNKEFIVVQGFADLVVLLPDEIWLVDFKTDQINEAELHERANLYHPQLRYYALALERIYRRPVKRAFLHFLALRKFVPLARETTDATR